MLRYTWSVINRAHPEGRRCCNGFRSISCRIPGTGSVMVVSAGSDAPSTAFCTVRGDAVVPSRSRAGTSCTVSMIEDWMSAADAATTFGWWALRRSEMQ